MGTAHHLVRPKRWACPPYDSARAPTSLDELDRQPFTGGRLSLDPIGRAEPEVGRQPGKELLAAPSGGEMHRILGPQRVLEDQPLSQFEHLLVYRYDPRLLAHMPEEETPPLASLPCIQPTLADFPAESRCHLDTCQTTDHKCVTGGTPAQGLDSCPAGLLGTVAADERGAIEEDDRH